MRNWSLFILAALSTCLLCLEKADSQEDMIVIKADAFEKPRRPPAVFRHDQHNDLARIEDCIECHHVYEDGKLLEDESSDEESCSDCHELNDNGQKPGLMKAFHTNCKDCHREKKKGPIMCGQCHVRRLPAE